MRMKRNSRGQFTNGKPKGKPISSACEKCGKIRKYPYPSFVKRFCSHKCSNQWKWENLYSKGQYLKCGIKHCHNLVWYGLRYFRPNHYLYGRIRFCSNSCWHKSRLGRTHIDIYGIEQAAIIKKKMSGRKPWNKGIKQTEEFRKRCVERAKEQWRVLDFRKKQMKRDFTKWAQAGQKALRLLSKEKKKNYLGGYFIRRKYLKKIGVKENA